MSATTPDLAAGPAVVVAMPQSLPRRIFGALAYFFVSDLSGLYAVAAVFGFIIAIMGCFHGFQVTGNAESVGSRTTQAVVEAISVVIVFDAFELPEAKTRRFVEVMKNFGIEDLLLLPSRFGRRRHGPPDLQPQVSRISGRSSPSTSINFFIAGVSTRPLR